MGAFERLTKGQGLFARALRGSALTAGAFAASQMLRLGSNLILTRFLLPDAFGLMALVSMFIIGLTLFSDMGIGPSISQHRRGDDPDFLNTAWTIQIARGVILWALACLLALPAAWFYAAPDLATLLPVAGFALVVAGFFPTRLDTATRHLRLGRVMGLDLVAQIVGLIAMVAVAWATGSVWALAIGGLANAVAKLVLLSLFLPGPGNRLRWEPTAAHDLIHFGKWIFLSTACSFLLLQGDRIILGTHLSLEELGIYNIGAFLATSPILLGQAVTGRILIPVYREQRDSGDALTRNRVRRLRMLITAALVGLLSVLALSGVWLVGVLYSDTYAAAGGIVVAVSIALLPLAIGLTYDQAALASGQSRVHFGVMLARAVVQTGAFLVGAWAGGLAGALIAQGLAALAVHPLLIWMARRYGLWDARHDLLYFGLALLVAALAAWVNAPALAGLAGAG